MAWACEHLEEAEERAGVVPRSRGCEECLKQGAFWVQLRLCLTCGHVGCCDSSPNKHATAHFHQTAHPVIRVFEPGEDWAWCYEDEEGAAPFAAREGEAPPVHYEAPVEEARPS